MGDVTVALPFEPRSWSKRRRKKRFVRCCALYQLGRMASLRSRWHHPRYLIAPVEMRPLSTATIGENSWLISWINFEGWFDAALPT